MKVFLSWSGPISKQVALTLREWLPNVLQAIDPWMSAEDIDKGSRWSSVLAKELATTKAGIVCLTPDNPQSIWLNFESGALSKAVDEDMVYPYLFRLKPSDLTGPLTQFQMSETNKSDTQKMVATLNKSIERPMAERKLLEAFEMWWPKLETNLNSIPAALPLGDKKRSPENMLEEVLNLARDQARTSEAFFGIVQRMQLEESARRTVYTSLSAVPASGVFIPNNPALNTSQLTMGEANAISNLEKLLRLRANPLEQKNLRSGDTLSAGTTREIKDE